MPKKPRKRTTPKKRDPSWQLRHALGHKVEPNPKAYTRKLKHPEEIDDPEIALNLFTASSLVDIHLDRLDHLVGCPDAFRNCLTVEHGSPSMSPRIHGV